MKAKIFLALIVTSILFLEFPVFASSANFDESFLIKTKELILQVHSNVAKTIARFALVEREKVFLVAGLDRASAKLEVIQEYLEILKSNSESNIQQNSVNKETEERAEDLMVEAVSLAIGMMNTALNGAAIAVVRGNHEAFDQFISGLNSQAAIDGIDSLIRIRHEKKQ